MPFVGFDSAVREKVKEMAATLAEEGGPVGARFAQLKQLFVQHPGSFALGCYGTSLFEFDETSQFTVDTVEKLAGVWPKFKECLEAISQMRYYLRVLRNGVLDGDITKSQMLLIGNELFNMWIDKLTPAAATITDKLQAIFPVPYDAWDLPENQQVIDEFLHQFIPPEVYTQEAIAESQGRWYDLIRSRATGSFAMHILQQADDDAYKAYAEGYRSHVLSEYLGSAWLNWFVGGPRRSFALRHRFARATLDTYLSHNIFGIPIQESGLSASLSASALPEQECDRVLSYIEGCVNSFFPTGTSYPTKPVLKDYYSRMVRYLKATEGIRRLEQPELPDFIYSNLTAILGIDPLEGNAEYVEQLQAAQDMSISTDLTSDTACEWFKKCFGGALMVIGIIIMVCAGGLNPFGLLLFLGGLALFFAPDEEGGLDFSSIDTELTWQPGDEIAPEKIEILTEIVKMEYNLWFAASVFFTASEQLRRLLTTAGLAYPEPDELAEWPFKQFSQMPPQPQPSTEQPTNTTPWPFISPLINPAVLWSIMYALYPHRQPQDHPALLYFPTTMWELPFTTSFPYQPQGATPVLLFSGSEEVNVINTIIREIRHEATGMIQRMLLPYIDFNLDADRGYKSLCWKLGPGVSPATSDYIYTLELPYGQV